MKKQRSLRGKVWQVASVSGDLQTFVKAERQGSVSDAVWEGPVFSDLSDPFDLRGMQCAQERILQAIETGERIMVYGDFDCDGITSTAALVHGLQRLGGKVSYRIPDRVKDSHGLKKTLLEAIAATGTKLVITVDCGVNDRAEVAYAAELGLEVIVTDHHQVDAERVVQQAVAVLNPNQPDCVSPHKNLAGVGVVFKLLQALNPDENWLQPYLALAAVGTVADCVSLTGESRILVQLGLQALNQQLWPGLAAWLQPDDPIDEMFIAFQLAPRLNAASRLGQVSHAVQLFLGTDNAHADRVEYLEQLNQQRRLLTADFVAQAENLVKPDLLVQVLLLEACELGILGLVASRLVEKLQQPVLCVARHPQGGFHGSARAPKGGNLAGALQACASYLSDFGGHDGAAGFRLQESSFPSFLAAIQDWYSQRPAVVPTLELAGILPAEQLDLAWFNWEKSLAPFGVGNPQPIWQVNSMTLEEIRVMGHEHNHARFSFIPAVPQVRTLGSPDLGGRKIYEAVAFYCEDLLDSLKIGKMYDLAITLNENRWNGAVQVQWQLVDVREVI